ncbi:MAG: hypothetical protein IPO22_14865 [Anaerolineales bacterium]|nr:hypothetical protein [Anaerolineales bacterium]
MEQDFFKLGVQAANTGDYQKAQAYFSQFVQANPNSEKGWLYLGHCLADAEKRVTCYQRVLRINPSNEEAQRALSALSQPNRPREINQDLYERQPAPVRSTEKARQMPPSQTAKPHKRSVNIVTILIGFVVGLIVCVGIVCVAISQMSPKTQALPTLTPIPTPSLPELNTAVLPPAVAPAGAGKACLGFWERGIACLDERGWQIYNNENMGFLK